LVPFARHTSEPFTETAEAKIVEPDATVKPNHEVEVPLVKERSETVPFAIVAFVAWALVAKRFVVVAFVDVTFASVTSPNVDWPLTASDPVTVRFKVCMPPKA